MENLNFLNNINNPLAWLGLAILIVGSILKLLPIKTLDKAQVERLLHKYLNSLIFCGLIAAALGIYFSNSDNGNHRPKPKNEPTVILPHPPTAPQSELALDEQVCQSLIGKYELSIRDYVFLEYENNDLGVVKGIRGIAKKGYWDAFNCAPDNEGNMILYGIDETEHAVEVKIEDKYIEVTRLTGRLKSEIYINENGNLYARRLFIDNDSPLLEDKNLRKSKISHHSDQIQKDIINAIDKYKELRLNRITHSTPDPCFPAIGAKDKKTFVISYCPTDAKHIHPAYFRAMVKCSNGRCNSIYDKLSVQLKKEPA